MPARRKKSKLAEKIRNLRQSHGMTQKEVAERLGVTEVAIYNYETGRRTPEPDKLEKLAEVFGVTLSELCDDESAAETVKQELCKAKQSLNDIRQRITNAPVPDLKDVSALDEITRRITYLEKTLAELTFRAVPTKVVPVVSKIPAGLPVFVGDPDVLDWHPVEDDSDVDYALVVEGDSLIDVGITTGDLALVHHTEAAEIGDLVVAFLGDETTLKYLARKNSHYVLRPANSGYQDIVIGREDIRIMGIVRGIVKRVPTMPSNTGSVNNG